MRKNPTAATFGVESDGPPGVQPPGEVGEEAGALVHVEDDCPATGALRRIHQPASALQFCNLFQHLGDLPRKKTARENKEYNYGCSSLNPLLQGPWELNSRFKKIYKDNTLD